MPGPRDFDPALVGNRETDAWAAYYRHEWVTFLRSAVGMVGAGFGMGRLQTLRGAYLVLRANQAWAPYPDNDPDAARGFMRRFYALVVQHTGALEIDPRKAAELEVEWWRRHREHQYGRVDGEQPLVAALTNLYSYVYSAPGEDMEVAARHRVRAMELSDAWVKAGCREDDGTLEEERAALVASYAALRVAVSRGTETDRS